MTDKKIRGEYQMRILLILRGAPGCGKTTYIKDHRLIPYTLSFDNIRMLFKARYRLFTEKNQVTERRIHLSLTHC